MRKLKQNVLKLREQLEEGKLERKMVRIKVEQDPGALGMGDKSKISKMQR